MRFILSIIICQLAGFIGSVFTTSSIDSWYKTLNKPSFNPPNWIFGPVWITLYTMMGISLYLVWSKGFENSQNKIAFYFFLVHLVANSLWSILFFGVQNLGLAFFEIIILWLMILVSIVLFYKIDSKAGLLLVPYLLWVSFASVLNFSIWRLN